MLWYQFMGVYEGGYECLHLYGGDIVLDECHVDLFACLSYKCARPLAHPLPISLCPYTYLTFIFYFKLIYRSLIHVSLPSSSFIICPLNSVFISAPPHLPSFSMPLSLPFHSLALPRSPFHSLSPNSSSPFYLSSLKPNQWSPPPPSVHLRRLRHPIHIPSSFRCNAY